MLQAGFPLLGHLSVVSSCTFCCWWLRWRPGEGMWCRYQCHSGFLPKVCCIMTCNSAEAMVLLTTSRARSGELVPYTGCVFLSGSDWKRFPSHRPSWQRKLGGDCVTRQSFHENLALGDRGLGLQPHSPMSVCLFFFFFFFKLNLYSDLFGQRGINAPEEAAEDRK